MDSRQPSLAAHLMCSDHEVAEFTWNHDRQAVTGKTHVLDAGACPPYGDRPIGQHHARQARAGSRTGASPISAPDAADRLRAVGYPSAASLMASGFGARCPTNIDPPRRIRIHMARRKRFENDFSEELGEPASSARRLVGPSLIEKIRATPTSSPHRPMRP